MRIRIAYCLLHLLVATLLAGTVLTACGPPPPCDPGDTTVSVSGGSPCGGTYWARGLSMAVGVSAHNTTYAAIVKLQIYIDGTLKQECTSIGTGPDYSCSYTWSTNPEFLPEGDHTILGRAIDKCGGQHDVTRTIRVDNTAPTVDFTGPDGRRPSGNEYPLCPSEGTVNVTASGSDNNLIEHIDLWWKGPGATEYTLIHQCWTSGCSYEWDISELAGTTHDWRAQAFDCAGNGSWYATTQTRVSGAPGIIGINPSGGAAVSGPTTITVTTSDADDAWLNPGVPLADWTQTHIATVQITVNKDGMQSVVNASRVNALMWQGTCLFPEKCAGEYSLTAKSTDQCGQQSNVVSTTVNVYCTTPPFCPVN